MTFYLATSNQGKLADFAGLAPTVHWELLPGFSSLPRAEETGRTFEANARLKAEFYSQYTDATVVADDSGLEVAALGGEPGVDSALYAGRHGDDEANNRLVLERLHGVPLNQRQAEFVCVLAVARAGRTLACFTGRAAGVILEAPRGDGGFGYDPLFFSSGAGCTFAELDPAAKGRYSHRGAAVRQIAEWIHHAGR
ncbi:MAG TPA: RdgB/HAM1 family non-canonical purine NTP pyrophosphatase [Terriglobales bacterium]|jgi:XTP/dITP diphosphohydrolase